MLDFNPLLQNAPVVFAIVLSVTVFFLIARVIRARQPVALAFALTPMLLYWTVQQTLV
jgi:hypothetical protein